MNAAELSSLIRDIPDFPKPGVGFKDITPVLAHPTALGSIIDLLAEPYAEAGITVVAGIEARGFVLATPVARALNAGFIPLRKPGKLPYETVSESYELEYGIDSLEAHIDAAGQGDRVLIVDDVIATGGTAAAAVSLLGQLGATVVGLAVFIELAFLDGRSALAEGTALHAVLTYD